MTIPHNQLVLHLLKPLLLIAMVLGLGACGVSPFAKPTASQPLLGMWTWRDTAGTCTEVHFYKNDGDAASWSGAEVLRKRYQIQQVETGVYLLTAQVTESNGQRDCTGGTTAVGASSQVYIRLLNGGGYFTCATLDTMSCYGSAMTRQQL